MEWECYVERERIYGEGNYIDKVRAKPGINTDM